MAYIGLQTTIFPFVILAILLSRSNTMVVGACNLLDSNIPQLPKFDFPPLPKPELPMIPELPKPELPKVPEFPKPELGKNEFESECD
ncbi:hypothetical protein L195_g046294 [Trifolium pratense]|uniref:Uncharacterized protein n=2 Tax=Trifolium pratense TaxID=57577 RepID=A0ACB0J423_TRIPR|nr:hypothetical protein L195_g046294 [Trifolium pratense]CAJ2639244.1 unnamed protein product [Trifolium pratense]